MRCRPGNRDGRDLWRAAGVVVVFLAVALLLRGEAVREQLLDPRVLRDLLRDDTTPLRAVGSRLVLVAGGGALIGFGLPRLWIALLAGALYGAWQGAVLALAAAVWGSLQAYVLGERLLRRTVERRLGGRLVRWRDRLRRDAFWWTLYARLFPVSNAMLTSAVCGISGVPWRPFVAASVLGMLPQAVAFAAFGSGGLKGDPRQVVVGGVLLATVLLLRRLWSRRLDDSGEI